MREVFLPFFDFFFFLRFEHIQQVLGLAFQGPTVTMRVRHCCRWMATTTQALGAEATHGNKTDFRVQVDAFFLLNDTTVNCSGSFRVSRAGFLHFCKVEVKGQWLSSRKSVTDTKQQRITGQEMKNLSCHLQLFHSFHTAAQGPRPLW